ncbi:putative bifunctional diguanylate cyclase/phosphodiesterase [Deinococcus planocerae]|uniref:putative bifunctional diguanylate cyclase/phosphodiesterase n=1 Tax=Deinococcus planocerae TaxID=1737569 RepID=UPI000C7E86CD|nr:bifunctional diguanylate cyclase/phosphodiesterase [Deinococcus planocerae]
MWMPLALAHTEPDASPILALKRRLYLILLPQIVVLGSVITVLAFPLASPERTICLWTVLVWALTYLGFLAGQVGLRRLEQFVVLNGACCFLSLQACVLFVPSLYSGSDLFCMIAPLVYIWAFMTLGTRAGTVVAAVFYLVSLALGMVAALLPRLSSFPVNPDLNWPLHLQYYVLSPLFIGFTYGSAALLDAQTAARLGAVTRQARTDPLTGLPNRLHFGEALDAALEGAKRREEGLALLFVDLDHFKTVNDVLGHAAGDDFLRDLAGRWRAVVREGDVLARISGDEFAMLVRAPEDVEDVLGVAERLGAAARRPLSLNGQPHLVTASVGVSLFPGHGRVASELLSRADLAMYQAKAARSGVCLFEPAMAARRERRRVLEQHLGGALDREELTLHYQPIFDLRTRELVGLEALLRWHPPALGPVSPAEFVPIAEESGMIVPIGAWVVRTACAQSRAWRDAGLTPPPVSVNVSPAQFERPDFAAQVLAALETHGLCPAALCLELTERGILHPGAHAPLATLRGRGLGIALDDFGIEYSSLARLHELPISGLKIDRSFTQALDAGDGSGARTVAHTIIALARALDLHVVAEGVETPGQVAELLASGCVAAQGYLLARPVPAAEVTARLAAAPGPAPRMG